MHKIIYLILASLLAVTGCSATRMLEKKNSDIATRESISAEEIMANNLTGNAFSINRADINYNIDGVSGRLNAVIRHKNPDTLLIILKHTTGVEFVRIYLNPDTVMINDRVNKRVMYGKPDDIDKRFGIDIKVIALAIGDIIINRSEDIRRLNNQKCQKGTVKSQAQINGKLISYEIDCVEEKIVSAVINGVRSGERIKIMYGNFFSSGGYSVPGRIEAEDMSNKAKVRMEIKNIIVPWDGQISFIPGSRYKKVMIR